MSAFSMLLVLALSVAPAGADDAVLLEFSANHCRACRTMQPAVSRLVSDGYPVQKIDVEQHPETARQFNVRAVPTYLLLAGNRELGRVEGATSYDRLARLFPAVPPAASHSAGADPGGAGLRPTDFNPDLSSADRPDQAALAASVRLKVEEAGGYGFGTGTIIGVHDDEALVVTCGHLFRESQGKGKIMVDLFAPGATQPVEGHLLGYDLTRDIALVSLRPGIRIVPATVAPAGFEVQPGDGAFTVGCDKGAAASVRETRITAVNKYRGKPNFTAAGAPIDGRSGGGLFASNGLLIGICNAADPQDDEGLYAGLASIHWQLDQIGQTAIYQQPAPPADLPQLPQTMPAQPIARSVPVTPVGYSAPPAGAPEGLGPDKELVVIIRSKLDPRERSEIYVVDQASPELLGNIIQAARARTQNRVLPASNTSQPQTAPSDPSYAQREAYQPQPVVRGQSGE